MLSREVEFLCIKIDTDKKSYYLFLFPNLKRNKNIFNQNRLSPPGVNQNCYFYAIYRTRNGIYPQYRALLNSSTILVLSTFFKFTFSSILIEKKK